MIRDNLILIRDAERARRPTDVVQEKKGNGPIDLR